MFIVSSKNCFLYSLTLKYSLLTYCNVISKQNFQWNLNNRLQKQLTKRERKTEISLSLSSTFDFISSLILWLWNKFVGFPTEENSPTPNRFYDVNWKITFFCQQQINKGFINKSKIVSFCGITKNTYHRNLPLNVVRYVTTY